MSPNKKSSAKTAKPASTSVKKAPAKAASKPEVYPGETAAERIIEADFNVVKGDRSDVWRDCVGAGRIGEGLDRKSVV